MIRLRPAQERGHFDHGWLKTWHSFNFAEYHDPDHEDFGALRVLNEDIVAPGRGFATHGHRDMEIITYVLSGSLEHRDSLGNGGVLHRDSIQRMRAGTGIRHSEANPDPKVALHLFQIWLYPNQRGLAPAYEDRSFDASLAQGRWQLLISPDGAEGSLDIAQAAHLWRVFLQPGEEVALTLPEGERHAWVQMANGQVDLKVHSHQDSVVNDGSDAIAGQLASLPKSTVLNPSDGAALSDIAGLTVKAVAPAEILVFGLA